MSDYLAKAHEEKLRAIQEVERKKQAEIQALKDEIDQLKKTASSGGAASAALVMTATPEQAQALGGEDLLALSKEDLISRIAQYRSFMGKYVVQAQEQKVQAVRAAENSLKQRFEEEKKQFLLQGQAGAATVASDKPGSLYDARNAAISAAAAAGKSRWGDKELQKVGVKSPPTKINVGAAIAASSGATVSPVANVNGASAVTVPPEVEAADHGLRADGGVGGLTLAERVALGSSASSGAAVPSVGTSGTISAADTLLYQQRTAKVVAAAAAGKSRWGAQEIERSRSVATSLLSSSASTSFSTSVTNVPVPPEVEAADHGLRADGGVGGLTLAERVALGSMAGGSSSILSQPQAVSVGGDSLYERRNVKVLEAASVGKSRWGPEEVERIKAVSSASLPAVGKGYSGGPTRVNLGASLLSN